MPCLPCPAVILGPGGGGETARAAVAFYSMEKSQPALTSRAVDGSDVEGDDSVRTKRRSTATETSEGSWPGYRTLGY